MLGKGALLFAEGRPSRGVYILCEGRAKLSICAESGKRMMLRVAGPGEVLGLGATLSGENYEVTAELLEPTRVVFVRRKELLGSCAKTHAVHGSCSPAERRPARRLRARPLHGTEPRPPCSHTARPSPRVVANDPARNPEAASRGPRYFRRIS